MARNHGRVYAAIWLDPTFTALSVGPQRLYMFLLSQPNMSHLGVLPLTERRWLRAVDGYTHDSIEADIKALVATRFVVVDEDTEELLVRTLFRNDNVYKQPNTLKAAISSVPAIVSQGIRTTLRDEVARVDLADLEESKRHGIAGLLAALLAALQDGQPDGSPDAILEPFAKPIPEPIPEPSTHARARPLPLAPTKNTLGHLTATDREEFCRWWDVYPRHTAKETASRSYTAARRTVTAETLLAGALRYRDDRDRKQSDPKFTAHAATWLNQKRWTDEPERRSNGHPQPGEPGYDPHKEHLLYR